MEVFLPKADKETLVQLLVALQTQAFCLGNNVTQLVKQWPKATPPVAVLLTTKEEASKFGISSEIND
jgi:hypothetical protein